MIHTLIFGGLVAAIGGLWWMAEATTGEPGALRPRDVLAAPVRAARWWLARRRWARTTRRAARAAWVAGADLVGGWVLTAPPAAELAAWHDVPPRDTGPACHAGRARCRECRLGGDCRSVGPDPDQRPAYAAGRALPRPGRHDVRQVLARWLAGDWWETPLPADLRLRLARMAGAVRAPVQLAGPVGRLP